MLGVFGLIMCDGCHKRGNKDEKFYSRTGKLHVFFHGKRHYCKACATERKIMTKEYEVVRSA